MADLSEALAEAYASVPQDVVVLHTLELRHPDFRDANNNPTAIRVVRDRQTLLATLEPTAPLNPGTTVEFIGFPFDFALPEENDRGGLPEITITVDNASAYLMPYLDQASESLVPIEVTYRPYLSTDTSAPHMDPVLTLTLKSIEANLSRVTARAGFEDLSNKRFPGVDYRGKQFPGLDAA